MPLTYRDLQDIASSSNWDEPYKERVSQIAPKLGKRLLGYLAWVIPQIHSYLSAEEIVGDTEIVAGWNELLQKNGSTKVLQQLLKIWENSHPLAEPVIFYGILDIRENVAVSRGLSEELSRLFNLIECIYFEKLLPKELIQLLKTDAASIASFADLSEEVKRYYYLHLMEEDGPEVLEPWKSAMEQNTEEIGTIPLNLLTGDVRPTIGNWLKAFAEMRSSTAVRGSYNIAYFVTNHPVASKLPDADKAVVADLLRLYAWLLRPEIFPDEMSHYEKERSSYYASVKADLMQMSVQEAVPVAKSALDAVSSSPVPQPVKKAVKLGGLAVPDNQTTKNDSQYKQFTAPQEPDNLVKELELGRQSVVLGGLVTSEGTNVEIDKETERLQQEREKKLQAIQNKLEELRKRNNLN